MKARYVKAKFVLPATLALAAPICVAPVWVAPAYAQVSVDTKALDSLPAAPPASAKKAAPHRSAPAHNRAARAEPARAESAARPDLPLPVPPLPPGASEAAAPAAAPAPGQTAAVPPIPAAPPTAAKIGPPETPPPLAALPPPPIPIAKDAPGDATAIPHGLRVTFGADRADLNDRTAAQLHDFAQTARADPNTPINVLAHAKGAPQDPSTPRRLALSRALAARAVLINDGIPSTRIYVRALGPVDAGDGPVDRVDLILGRPAVAEAESTHPGAMPAGSAAPAAKDATGQPPPAPADGTGK